MSHKNQVPEARKSKQAVTKKSLIQQNRHWVLCCVAALFAVAGSFIPAPEGLRAQQTTNEPAQTSAPAPTEPTRGPVTNLPLPRFVSLKASEGNARRGPSLNHRIDWVFKRKGMPLEVIAEYGHWRRVQDRDGAGGWVHYALLSGVRTVLVEEDMLRVHSRPDLGSITEAAFELGVVAQLGACTEAWCEITAGGHTGWTLKSKLWGVRANELRP